MKFVERKEETRNVSYWRFGTVHLHFHGSGSPRRMLEPWRRVRWV